MGTDECIYSRPLTECCAKLWMFCEPKRPYEKVLHMMEANLTDKKCLHRRSKQWQQFIEAVRVFACYALYPVIPIVIFFETLFLSRVCVCVVRSIT